MNEVASWAYLWLLAVLFLSTVVTVSITDIIGVLANNSVAELLSFVTITLYLVFAFPQAVGSCLSNWAACKSSFLQSDFRCRFFVVCTVPCSLVMCVLSSVVLSPDIQHEPLQILNMILAIGMVLLSMFVILSLDVNVAPNHVWYFRPFEQRLVWTLHLLMLSLLLVDNLLASVSSQCQASQTGVFAHLVVAAGFFFFIKLLVTAAEFICAKVSHPHLLACRSLRPASDGSQFKSFESLDRQQKHMSKGMKTGLLQESSEP
eukprot:ANDGO_06986.mRNA.1 hypothetical protein